MTLRFSSPSWLATPLAALVLSSCFPLVEDPASDVVFVREVVPLLLGRQPRGSGEVRVLNEIAAHHGREVLVDVLMDREEFVDYWTLELIDDVKGARGDTGPLTVAGECFGPPGFTGSAPREEWAGLVNHIATSPTTSTFTVDGGAQPAFNMTDVVRASIDANNILPIYQGMVFPMVAAGDSDSDSRDRFYRDFVGRDSECLDCHNARYSKTDAWSGWDRYDTFPYALEHTLWAFNPTACDPLDPPAPGSRTADILAKTPDAANAPGYGECAYCHLDPGTAPSHVERIPALAPQQIVDAMIYGVNDGNMYAVASHWSDQQVADQLALVVQMFGADPSGQRHCLDWKDPKDIFDHKDVTFDGTGTRPWGMDQGCGEFHDPGSSATGDFAGLTPGVNYNLTSLAEAMSVGVGTLPGDLTTAHTTLANDTGTFFTAEAPTLGSGQSALTFLIASKIADNLLTHTGAMAVVDHGHARNEVQLTMHGTVTQELLDTGFSLKAALRLVVLSDGFARLAPSDSLDTSDAYLLPMIVDPWVEHDPREGPLNIAGEDENGQGDGVHRHTTSALLTAASSALDWDTTPLLFNAVDHPTTRFAQAIGQQGLGSDGFDDVTFQALLEWEATVGQCANLNSSGTDWIAVLMNRSDTLPGWTVRRVVEALNDRILQDPTIVHEAELSAFLPLPLNARAFGQRAVLEPAIRNYCGVLLTSPQFMLAGIRPETAVAPLPTKTVCSAGDPLCQCADVAAEYQGPLDAELGYTGAVLSDSCL